MDESEEIKEKYEELKNQYFLLIFWIDAEMKTHEPSKAIEEIREHVSAADNYFKQLD